MCRCIQIFWAPLFTSRSYGPLTRPYSPCNINQKYKQKNIPITICFLKLSPHNEQIRFCFKLLVTMHRLIHALSKLYYNNNPNSLMLVHLRLTDFFVHVFQTTLTFSNFITLTQQSFPGYHLPNFEE